MESFEFSGETGLKQLCSWMHDGCEGADKELLRWMKSALIGQYYHHRLGIVVRVRSR